MVKLKNILITTGILIGLAVNVFADENKKRIPERDEITICSECMPNRCERYKVPQIYFAGRFGVGIILGDEEYDEGKRIEKIINRDFVMDFLKKEGYNIRIDQKTGNWYLSILEKE